MHKPISIVFASLLAFTPEACSHAVGSGNGPDPAPGLAAQAAPPSAGAPLAPAAAGAPVAAAAGAAVPGLYRVPVDGLPAIGDPEAPVTIVEFTDYQCPFCQRAEHTIVRLRATYGDALRVVIAERPLPFHDHARPAALAALAANAQGKFEPMHERLFALGKQLDDDAVASAAADSGVDLSRAYDDGTLARSEKLADSLGVTGTPTFFVDGRIVKGAQPYETFRDVVEERLTAARALEASGTLPRDVYTALVANGSAHVDPDTGDHPENCGGNCDDAPGAAGAAGGPCGDAPGAHGAAPAPAFGDAVEAVPTEGAPAFGPSGAAVTIVAFSDFECPYCARAAGTMHALEAAHPGAVRVVFKQRPLPMHPHAREAAIASLAADRQGHFWEFHDRVFARQGVTLDRAGLVKLAGDLGLDVGRFTRDLDDAALAERVDRDGRDADALGVKGTPTFFVNGHRVVGAQPQATFEAAMAK